MKAMKFLLVALLLATVGSSPALADRRHHSHAQVGVYLGIPFAPWPWYYPYWDYPSRVVVVPAPQPPVYVEQSPAPAAPQTSYWYYCVDAKAYYPYVKECPGGWQQVVPQTP